MNAQKKVKRILVVDDQAVARRVISGLLVEHGHVDLAENGQDALSMYAEAIEDGWLYDLICMDIEMPGLLDGNKTVKCIRLHEKKLSVVVPVPVVMISSHSDMRDLAESQGLNGASDYITKPFSQVRINEVINRYLQR